MIKFCVLFTLLISYGAECSFQSTSDWLKHLTRLRTTVEMIDAVTEPLYNVLPYEKINYSSANVSNDYKSVTVYRPMGMAQLYAATEHFIGFLVQDESLTKDLVNVADDDDGLTVANISKEWPLLLKHYGLVLVVLFLLLLYVLGMPTIFVTFCCYQYVGQYKSPSQPFDKRCDPCRRYFYGALLLSVTVMMSFGVVCVFSTNEAMDEGTNELPDNMRVALRDTNLFLNNTKKEANTLLVTNHKELDSTLTNIMEGSGKIIINKLVRMSRASAVFNLTALVDGLKTVRTDLRKMENLTIELQGKSLQLAQGLKESRETLVEKLRQCSSQIVCQEFMRMYDIQNLAVDADFEQLPNVTVYLQNLSSLMTEDAEEEVTAGNREFEKMQDSIQSAVAPHIPAIRRQIQKIGISVGDINEQIEKVLNGIKNYLSVHTNSSIESGREFIDAVSPIRYYVFFGACVIFLAVLTCLFFGLTCGVLGTRPNSGYRSDCCNRGTGSYYLIIAMWTMFLSSSMLMILVMVCFTVGVTTDNVYCHSAHNLENSFLVSVLDHTVDVNKYYKNTARYSGDDHVYLSDIIRACHKNQSLYQVLQLQKYLDISKVSTYTHQFNIPEYVNHVVANIKLLYDMNILTPEARRLLQQLSDSSITRINFLAYTRMVNEKITSYDLTQLAAAINDTALSLPPRMYEVKHSFLNHALYLKTHQEYLVSPMLEMTKQLDKVAQSIQEQLKFNHTSLKKAVDHLVFDIDEAQIFLKREGHNVIRQLGREFGEEFVNHVEDYLAKVITSIESDIGHCWPISQVYNATVVATCKRILNPFNGFWMSMSILLLLYIPALALCAVLAELYQKSEPYPGPLAEAEYLCDFYGNDHVPLHGVQPGKKRAATRTEAVGTNTTSTSTVSAPPAAAAGAATAVSGRVRVPGLPPKPPMMLTISGVSVNERATADVVPKHLSDTQSAHSSNASIAANTEYERPPPYYCPKNSDDISGKKDN